MRKFLLGFVEAVIVLLVAGFCFVHFGFLDPRADIPINPLEMKIVMPSLDAAVGRRAPETTNPVLPTNESLAGGTEIYQTNSARCHGDVHRPHDALADSLYPSAPQISNSTNTEINLPTAGSGGAQ